MRTSNRLRRGHVNELVDSCEAPTISSSPKWCTHLRVPRSRAAPWNRRPTH